MQSLLVVALDVDGHAVRTTTDHPFYTDAGWVNASDLKAGDRVRTQDGIWATVRAVAVERPQPVYLPRLRRNRSGMDRGVPLAGR